MRGVDISENNGSVNFEALANEGVKFVIIRLGYGRGHLDSEFYNNVQGARDAGLKIGVYYYDYAVDVETAKEEAHFMLETLEDCGLSPEDLPMGVWYDMEDADGWKDRHGMPNRLTITAMCSAFIVECNKAGYNCGIYASLDWLENKIATDLLADYVPYWVAQWSDSCDFPRATLWQYTNEEEIDGRYFDGNFKL